MPSSFYSKIQTWAPPLKIGCSSIIHPFTFHLHWPIKCKTILLRHTLSYFWVAGHFMTVRVYIAGQRLLSHFNEKLKHLYYFNFIKKKLLKSLQPQHFTAHFKKFKAILRLPTSNFVKIKNYFFSMAWVLLQRYLYTFKYTIFFVHLSGPKKNHRSRSLF